MTSLAQRFYHNSLHQEAVRIPIKVLSRTLTEEELSDLQHQIGIYAERDPVKASHLTEQYIAERHRAHPEYGPAEDLCAHRSKH